MKDEIYQTIKYLIDSFDEDYSHIVLRYANKNLDSTYNHIAISKDEWEEANVNILEFYAHMDYLQMYYIDRIDFIDKYSRILRQLLLDSTGEVIADITPSRMPYEEYHPNKNKEKENVRKEIEN